MDGAWYQCLHFCRIVDNRAEPSGHLGLAELYPQVTVKCEQRDRRK